MKRRSRYPDKVIAYALAQRGRGTKWKDIVDGIKQEFGIRPPSERQMRDWYKELGGGSADPERLLRESLVQVARATTPLAAFAAQKLAIQQVVPELVEAWRKGESPWIAGGTMIVSMLEQTVGSDTYDAIIRRYQQIREERGEKLVSLKDQEALLPGWIRTEESEERREQ